MNAITLTATAVTMTSREIAELTGKEHKNVLSDTRQMLEGLRLTTADFSAVYKADNGQTYEQFVLPKRESLILVSGYSVAMRAKIIDRWQELEAQAAQPALNPANFSRLQLIELAMQAEQECLALAKQKTIVEQQLAIAAPKVAGFERIALCEGNMSLQMAAKSLGIDPLKRLFSWLHENNWTYKRVGSDRWLAHQDKIRAGLLDHKNYAVRQDDGSEKMYPSVVVTPRGLAKLAELVPCFTSKNMTTRSGTTAGISSAVGVAA